LFSAAWSFPLTLRSQRQDYDPVISSAIALVQTQSTMNAAEWIYFLAAPGPPVCSEGDSLPLVAFDVGWLRKVQPADSRPLLNLVEISPNAIPNGTPECCRNGTAPGIVGFCRGATRLQPCCWETSSHKNELRDFRDCGLTLGFIP
jgi:hypothetical protein